MAYVETPLSVFPVDTPFTPVYEETDGHYIVETSEVFYPFPDRAHLRMVFLLGFVLGIASLFVLIRPTIAQQPPQQDTTQSAAQAGGAAGALAVQVPGLVSSVFTAEVQYWAPQIARWAAQHNLDPNIVATIMQIESCGDPLAVSRAGAQGLFQVMPFHFQPGENTLDPETNAARGLAYFVARLAQTNGDVGRAFAGYNGGHVAAGNSWDHWAAETQRYFLWSTGIYGEVLAGATESETLQRWLEAGGASLCRQAAGRLGM